MHGFPTPPLALGSPNVEAKSQLLSSKKPLKIWLIIIKVVFDHVLQNIFTGLVLRELGQGFRSAQLSKQVPNLDSKSVVMWTFMSYLRLGNPCEAVSLNFSRSRRLRLHISISSNLGITCVVVSPDFHALNG